MSGPLDGVRVLELGTLIAGPFATRVLADLGAEVLKIESPSGDPLRTWGTLAPTGWSWWSYVQSRGKHLACVDLKTPEGRDVVRRLMGHVDVVVENFRRETLEAWGLGPEAIAKEHPDLIYVALSGYGLSGPKRNQPGFGNVAEAIGGLRYVTGEPGRAPMRTGVSIGDTLAALYGVIGAVSSLFARERGRGSGPAGEVVDVALAEAVFSVTEGAVTEYLHSGVVRERTGNRLQRSAPSNVYRSADGHWVALGANSEGIFQALCQAMGRPDLPDDPRFATNVARVANQEELDGLIGEWVGARPAPETLTILEEAKVPAGSVQSVADIAVDPQFLAREMFVDCADPADDELGSITMPAPVPRFWNRAHRSEIVGGAIGRDTQVIARWLDLDEQEYSALLERGVLVDASAAGGRLDDTEPEKDPEKQPAVHVTNKEKP